MITVNVLGTINEEATCVTVDDSVGHRPGYGSDFGGAEALGGTAVGHQVNTAQTGKQNLNCGNSHDILTLNVVGTVRKHTTCAAADHSYKPGYGVHHRGEASADAGQTIGFESSTGQNGRQNQACGDPGDGIDLPLGQIKRKTKCNVWDASTTTPH
ncbi:hypothetical protein ACFW1M_38550 [Streptomyces inhibens]|uniref:hypothetical protein n=1 Tax=Streptomyces inhibens TaxID=2293571 RepID=UPI0036853807